MSERCILIADDEPDMRWVLAGIFKDAGFRVEQAADGEQALRAVLQEPPDVVLSDVRMPKMNGIDLLRMLQQRDRHLPVILLSAMEDLETAVGAMKIGAYDYLAKPFDQERLLLTVERAAQQRRLQLELDQLRGRLEAKDTVHFGPSGKAKELARTIDLVARQGTLSVLICGESGTGKEVVAREIHRRSTVARGPFVAVDCGALPEPLMESQLFGHRKGSFTGADQDRPGLFRMAQGGTLFLDELGNLPLALQAKLLRALQERSVVPVGGGDAVPFEARLLCATNSNLEREVKEGRFRIDLYHRVAEFVLQIPSLRARPEDIVHFANAFLLEANLEMGRQVERLTEAASAALVRREWPGNLRELRNVIRRAVLMCAATELDVADLTHDSTAPLEPPSESQGNATQSLTERIRQATEALEAEILRETFQRLGGNKAAVARALQIDYTTLYRKLKRHGLLTMASKP